MRFLTAVLPFAALLLSPVTAPAQTPNILPAIPSNSQYRTIALQHACPADILSTMHWQADKSAGGAKLPDGVSRIFALQSSNRLLVEATPDGYERIKEIVTALDIAPQQVKLTARFVAVPLSQKLTFNLSNPNQSLLQINSVNSLVSQPFLAIVENDKPAYFSLPWLHLDQLPGITPSKSPELRLVPCVNKDNSITISLNAKEPTAQVLEGLRTIPNGAATVYDATAFLPASKYRVFLFVTPTVLSTGANDGIMKSRP